MTKATKVLMSKGLAAKIATGKATAVNKQVAAPKPVIHANPARVIVKVEAARHAAPATKLEWVVKANPKRLGSASHTRAASFWGKPTVGEMLAAGATRLDLCWSADRGELVLKS